MWHFNIPIFRRLDKVAGHEKDAVVALARTWWGFAEGVPKVLKTVRLNGIVPMDGRTAPRSAPRAPRGLQPPGPAMEAQDIATTSAQNNEVSFEVLRAQARSAGSRLQSFGQRSSTEVEGGFVRPVKPLASSCSIFRMKPQPSPHRPVVFVSE
ncbi:unnamed protein product [Effrenium voratum]|uniref:Uncharacterized protein n=1 Tax=Effrenium voratum TaxID=2562239 RepID=A0AA36J4F3_9DINO|nr:unnamed protein product [Effrenium voratum]